MKIIISLLFGLVSFGAYAQEDTTTSTSTGTTSTTLEQPAPDANETKTLKKIEITGSYIKRVDEEGPSPVQTIRGDDLKKSGYNSVADVLRENAYTAQDSRENSLSTTPGVATAGIGAFTSDSILVLLDGQRLPKVGGDNIVDLNMIPMAAIERIEILKDGASALYGSDAIGGVMNFITKKDFNGTSFAVQRNQAAEKGGERTDVTISTGRNFSRGNILGVVQLRRNEEMADADREYSTITDVKSQGSAIGNYGSWVDMNGGANNGGSIPSDFCPEANKAPGGLCRFDYSKYGWGLPEITQASTMLTGNVRLSENIKSRTTGSFVYREVNTQLAPAPDTMRISNNTAVNVMGLKDAQGNAPTGDVVIRYRLADEAGPRQNNDKTTTYNIAQSLEGKISGSWSWDLSGTYGEMRERATGTGYADKAKIIDKINKGLFNPLAAPGQKGDISDTFFTSEKETNSSLGEVKLVTTGQLYEGGESFGPIAMAVGTSSAWQGFENTLDPITASKNAYGTVGAYGAGDRNFYSVFQELSIFPVNSLEVGLATRYDKYNDFGDTFNPKFSISWQATEKTLFRTSIGTGFRAPNMSDVYAGEGYGFPTFRDEVYCAKVQGTPGATDAEINSACFAQQQLTINKNNPNLKEETSLFWNVGFLTEPKKDWNIEGNFWVARVKDRVGAIDVSYLTQAEAEYTAQLGQAAAAEKMLNDYGVIVHRAPNGALVDIVMPSAFNLPEEIKKGIDLRISHDVKLNVAGVPFNGSVSVDHVHFLKSQSEDFPGLGITSNRNIDWKNNITLALSKNYHTGRFVIRTVSGGDRDASYYESGWGSLPTFTTYDVVYSYGNLFGGTLNAGIKNLAAYNTPRDYTIQAPSDQITDTVYDTIGRQYFLGYNYTF